MSSQVGRRTPVTEQKQRTARCTPIDEGVVDPISRAARRGSACVVPFPALTGTAHTSAFCIFVQMHRKGELPLENGHALPRHLHTHRGKVFELIDLDRRFAIYRPTRKRLAGPNHNLLRSRTGNRTANMPLPRV